MCIYKDCKRQKLFSYHIESIYWHPSKKEQNTEVPTGWCSSIKSGFAFGHLVSFMIMYYE